jgi:hypothetical protein
MAVKIESPMYKTLETESSTLTAPYWWATSGRDLSNMLHEAAYSSEVQHAFLSYFRDTISAQLGAGPDANSSSSSLVPMSLCF